MSQKLTLMKNQIMEYDRYVGMNRKYGAVRIQTIKHHPVTVSFFEDLYLFVFIFSSNSLKKNKRKTYLFGILSSIPELLPILSIVKTLRTFLKNQTEN